MFEGLSGIRELRWATRARSRPSPTTTTYGSDVQRRTAAQRGEETSENEKERERERERREAHLGVSYGWSRSQCWEGGGGCRFREEDNEQTESVAAPISEAAS
ncbi:hypothetical protein Sjap_014156 [Stephania japonica]|uniref:Uncharacterized protein n=1 Tax=Stephania japonica TaxID=461633 RepID=A0AAP0NZQ2_9MAGN